MIKFLTQYPFAGTFLWVLLAGIFCWSQSPLGLSIFAAGCGASVGAVLSYLARDSKLQPLKVLALVLLLMLSGSWLTDLIRWFKLPSLVLGGPAVYSLSDAFFWGWECALVVFLLRWTSTVKPAFMSLELLVAGGTLVELFSAHRHGFVNRPYAIVDPLWSRGIDPLPVFLAFGALIAILILVLGATHSPKRGRWVDVVGLVLVMSCLFLFAPLERLKDLPRPPEATQGQDSDEHQRSAGANTQESHHQPRGQGNTGDQTGQSSGQGDQTGQDSGQGDQTGQDSGQGDQTGQDSGQGDQAGQDSGQGDQAGQDTGQGDQTGQNPNGDPQQGDSQSGSSDQGDKPQGQSGQEQQEGQDRPGKSPPTEESSNTGKWGESDELSFRDRGNSSQNPPIAVVIFRDDYTPDSGMYYFRQNVFSQYNGTKLVTDTSGKYDRDLAAEFPGTKPTTPQVPKLDKTIFRELETRVALLSDHAKPFGLTNPTQWRAIPNPDPKRFQKAFEVTSMVLDKELSELLGRRAGDPSWDTETWAHYTAAPEDPRYAKLLEEIVAQFPDAPKDDPLIRALMVKLWLEENGVYSLRSTHDGAADPTAHFLFGDRTGYCVYFAHAAVFLYRTAGMPARNGSGYAVEASQRGNGSSLLVPSQSAHSWPEVYIDGMGWVVLDISPAKTLDPPPPPSDPGLQQMLGEMARQDPEEEPVDPIEDKIDVQEMLRNAAQALASAVPWALLLLLILAYGVKLYRRYEPYTCPEQDLPDATLRSLLDLLFDAGFSREKGEPREAFARRLCDLSPSFHNLTKAHLRHRLGNPKTSPAFPWKKTFLDARSEIGQNASTIRLLRGSLNPITWMKVH